MPTINLTDKNMELLKAVVEVMKADINWDEVAKKADMKTSKYARDSWTIVRNKLITGGEGGAKEGAGKKRKDSATETSAPTPKKAKTGKGKKAGEDGEGAEVKDEEEDEF